MLFNVFRDNGEKRVKFQARKLNRETIVYSKNMTNRTDLFRSSQTMFNQRCLVFLVVVTAILCVAYCLHLFYYSSEFVGGTSYENLLPDKQPIPYGNKTDSLRDLKQSSYLNIRPFEINGHDIMVFVHIQKTGGTFFGRNLVKNLHLQRKCVRIANTKSRYMCTRPNSDEYWLYSRYSTGWVCGLHADFTTWNTCLPNVLKSRLNKKSFDNAKLFYITILRDPVNRFLSEYKHVQRGATWITSKFICNNKRYYPPTCYEGMNWSTVTLSEFLECPYNLAFNRQTRMLANLTEVGCYDNVTEKFNYSKQYGRIMLESAKRNLRSMAYFGLLEYQKESQYLFEKTFGLKFMSDFSQVPPNETMSDQARSTLTPKLLLQVLKVTRLDRQLYNYAKSLFFRRLKYFDRIEEMYELNKWPK